MVDFCNWCPVPRVPSPAYHPDGQAEHVPLRTWAEVAAGLRRAGWTVEYRPVTWGPPYLWRPPDGEGLNHRSADPEAPPESVMWAAANAGVIGFTQLAPAPEKGA